MVIGTSGTLLTSTNGVDWLTGYSGTTESLLGAGLDAAGHFLVVGSNGVILFSYDAVNWSPQNSGTILFLSEVVTGTGKTFIVGDDTLILAPPSYSGSWHNINDSAAYSYDLYSATFGTSGFVAVGQNGTILASPEGAQWQKVDSGVAVHLLSVATGGGLYVAVGLGGAVVSSSDGSSWTPGYSGVTANLHAICYGDGRFLAVGDQGTVLVSTDGSHWLREDAGTLTDLRGAAFGSGQFVVVGLNGLILSGRRILPMQLSVKPENPAGYLDLTVSATLGQVYDLERASRLTNWTSVGTFTNRTGADALQLPIDPSHPSDIFRTRTP